MNEFIMTTTTILTLNDDDDDKKRAHSFQFEFETFICFLFVPVTQNDDNSLRLNKVKNSYF